MTIEDLLEFLDGHGIVITDDDSIMARLNEKGLAIFDELIVSRA